MEKSKPNIIFILTDQQRYDTCSCYGQEFFSKQISADDLFAGVNEMLLKLKKQGYQLAVATGKSRAGLNKALTGTRLNDFFHITRCADETASKPAPDMLLELLQELDKPAAKTLVIGDTEFDMQMAQSAGCDRIAVSYGVHDAVKLSPYSPLEMIHTPSELVQWFDVNMLQ